MHAKGNLDPDNSLNTTSIVTRIAGSSIVSVKPIFTSDSKFLISVSGSTIKIFSVITGACIQELRAHKNVITSIKINVANQFQLYSVSNDRTIIKWDFTDNFPLKTFKVKANVIALYTIPDDTDNLLFLSSCKNQGSNELVKYNLKTGKYTRVMEKCSDKEKCTTVGIKGLFYATVFKKNLTFYNNETKKTYSHSMKADPHSSAFTSIISHPKEICVATGCNNGMIYLWYDFLNKSEMPKRTIKHWHNLPIGDICFSPEGSLLFSGGQECVLVKWPINTGKESKDTLPRMGSPLEHIVCSPDATVYAICHSDNSIRMVTSNFHVKHILQGLVRCFTGRATTATTTEGTTRPAFQLDPRTQSLVASGTPGHLQFYDVYADRQRFNLDIVGQNYVSPITIEKPLDLTDIELYAFNDNGTWMATYERRDDGYTTSENKLKFWFFNDTNQSYELNTQVELPHRRKMNDLKFRPKVKGDSDEMLVTSSNDGDFKTWILTEDNDIYRDNECWRCIKHACYRNTTSTDNYLDVGVDTGRQTDTRGQTEVNKPGEIAFSSDGSVMSVVFHSESDHKKDVVTIWEPITSTLKCVIDNPCKEKICSVVFGKGNLMNLLLVHSVNHLCVWDIFTKALMWYKEEKAVKVVADKNSDFIAVFTTNNELKIMTLETDDVLYNFEKVSHTNVESALFVTRDDPQPLPRINLNRATGSPPSKEDTTTADDKKTSASPDKKKSHRGRNKSNGFASDADVDMEVAPVKVVDKRHSVVRNKRNRLDWQNQSKLYFINKNQELLTLDFSINEIRRILEMQPVNLNKENDDSLFAQLLSKDDVTLDTNSKHALTSTRASNTSVLLKKIIESSPATLPPMNLMLKDLIDSFFTCDMSEVTETEATEAADSGDDSDDDAMKVDYDSGSDFEVAADVPKTPEKRVVLLSDEEDLEIPMLKYFSSLVPSTA